MNLSVHAFTIVMFTLGFKRCFADSVPMQLLSNKEYSYTNVRSIIALLKIYEVGYKECVGEQEHYSDDFLKDERTPGIGVNREDVYLAVLCANLRADRKETSDLESFALLFTRHMMLTYVVNFLDRYWNGTNKDEAQCWETMVQIAASFGTHDAISEYSIFNKNIMTIVRKSFNNLGTTSVIKAINEDLEKGVENLPPGPYKGFTDPINKDDYTPRVPIQGALVLSGLEVIIGHEGRRSNAIIDACVVTFESTISRIICTIELHLAKDTIPSASNEEEKYDFIKHDTLPRLNFVSSAKSMEILDLKENSWVPVYSSKDNMPPLVMVMDIHEPPTDDQEDDD